MNLRALPLRWILVLAVLVGVGAWRIRLALRPTEDVLRTRIEALVDALEDRAPRRIIKALTDDYLDEASRHDRRDVANGVRSVLMFGDRRLRGELDPVDGFEVLTPLEGDTDEVTVRIHCRIESRPAGTATPAPYEPWWDLRLTADMVHEGGAWRIRRTRDVNHGDRPRW